MINLALNVAAFLFLVPIGIFILMLVFAAIGWIFEDSTSDTKQTESEPELAEPDPPSNYAWIAWIGKILIYLVIGLLIVFIILALIALIIMWIFPY